MPYLNGVRVTQDEFARARADSPLLLLHTGPNGENPAPGPEIDPETSAPKAKKRAGTQRSKTNKATTKAAIANALGTDAESLADIDVSSLDVEPTKED